MLCEDSGASRRQAVFAEAEETLYAKRIVCETSIGYAVYSGEGRFLAFVESLGDAMLAAHHYNLPLNRLN